MLSRRRQDLGGSEGALSAPKAPSSFPITRAVVSPGLGALLGRRWSETRQVPDHVAREVSGITSAFVAWHLDRNLRFLAHVER